MKEFILKNSSGKRVLLLAMVTALVYSIMLFITIPRVTYFASEMKPLDLLPGGYGYNYVSGLFSALGPAGRHAYLYYQIPVDLVFPLLFALTCILFTAYLLKKINRYNSKFFYLCFIPVIGGVADYAENFSIIMLLGQYPNISAITVKIANFFTVVKFAAIFIFVVVAVVLLLQLKSANRS